jgi:hypothetical protein
MVDAADLQSLRAMLHRITEIKGSEKVTDQIVRAVMQLAPQKDNNAVCYLSTKRVVPYREMKKLSESVLLEYVPQIIAAGLDEHGPFQSAELLHKAALMIGGRPAFVKPDGSIVYGDLVLAGYILSIAGFERKSHHIKELGRPAKCWKLTESKHLSIEERARSVVSVVRTEIARVEGRDEPAPIKAPPANFGSFY